MDMQMDPGNVQEATLTLASRCVQGTHQKSTAPASRAARQDALSNEDAAHHRTDHQQPNPENKFPFLHFAPQTRKINVKLNQKCFRTMAYKVILNIVAAILQIYKFGWNSRMRKVEIQNNLKKPL